MDDGIFITIIEELKLEFKKGRRQRRITNVLLAMIIALILILLSIHFIYCPCLYMGLEENAIHKRVIFEGGGEPIENANVSIYLYNCYYDSKFTDGNGWANWTGLADGKWTIKVDADNDGNIDATDWDFLWDGEVWELTNEISPEICRYGIN